MKKLTKTIACAAATAATTLVATTVAIETATAASFTSEVEGRLSGTVGTLKIEYGGGQFASSTAGEWDSVSFQTEEGSKLTLKREQSEDGEVEWWFLREAVERPEVGELKLLFGKLNDSGDLLVGWTEYFAIEGGEALDGSDRTTINLAEFVVASEEDTSVDTTAQVSTPEPSSAIALGVLGLGAVASRLRRRSK